ncbi:hypothetical protein Kpol_530p6 [Vanderwaltozyma polyspora DSM 70294]|uniref:Protein SBE22 n=1 Tax=Vanderwaltozyma polyspora (strain ATCC 22028 / DSM 70294 / BCRC 21397 / CBS 2163 / NBRC 10782 / NRRL Y-8283 / UCD 57-17) TaxID=436907 RepID=SBE22_VANPO|nr:uncharacterized protein Kpol_530p6 [Vanderwaltozyma polyspora DSM 70294]A7TKY1.1 RecName: Full=Protein SBE22 [Vanderwaltozyma polyspora DSM 70294]EDO17037.1 hypothetical protein Kpol_530p6 [Vanderwaltozyma polyspora DSM 70294]
MTASVKEGAHSEVLDKRRVNTKLGQKITANSLSSDANSSMNSKRLGLGIARRPGDNLLASISDNYGGKYEVSGENMTELPQPRGLFIHRNDRPISDDSIVTKNSELFSSGFSDDNNSGASSVETDELSSEGGINLGLNNLTVGPIASDEHNMDGSFISDNFEESFISTDSVSTLHIPNENRNHDKSFSYENGPQSRAHKMISTNTTSSTINANNMKSTGTLPPFRPRSNSYSSKHLGTSTLYDHSNSTSAILPNKQHYLTPSQRYRMRKERNDTSLRNSIRKKERFYDEQEPNMELQEGDIDDSLIWNIPMASFSTNSFLMSSGDPKHVRSHQSKPQPRFPQRHNFGSVPHFQPPLMSSALDFKAMPTSPVPGIDSTSDLQFIRETTENLSSVYLQSSNRLSRSKLLERTDSAEVLPIEFKEASEKGMEDLILVSEDKLDVVSHSRPSWLPPKDPEEKKLHENQISKSMSIASFEQLDRNKESEERHIQDETNRQKYVLLLDRGVTRNSSIQSLKKMIWETPLTVDTRWSIYDQLLQSDVRLISEQYIESFEQIMQVLNKMEFPRNKETEIEKLIDNSIKNKISGKQNISNDLLLMLQLKSISHQGLIPGDELLFHHFLTDPSTNQSLQHVWELVNLIQLTCFNDFTKEKYDIKIVEPRGVVSKYLSQDDSFKSEFNTSCLNSTTWWNILERVDHNLFMWIMDIIVVANSQCFKNYPINREKFKNKSWEYYKSKKVIVEYKVLASFALNVLLNYHFGFNDLISITTLEDKSFCIPMPLDNLFDEGYINNVFIRKWLHYYKKF